MSSEVLKPSDLLAHLAESWSDDAVYDREDATVKVEIQIACPIGYEVYVYRCNVDGSGEGWGGSIKEMLKAFHKAAYDSGVKEANDCWKYGA